MRIRRRGIIALILMGVSIATVVSINCCGTDEKETTSTVLLETEQVVTTSPVDVFDLQVEKRKVKYTDLNVHYAPFIPGEDVQIQGYENVTAALHKGEEVYILQSVSFMNPTSLYQRLWYYITTVDGTTKGWVVSDGLS